MTFDVRAHRMADDRMLGRAVRSPGDARPRAGDLDRFARAAGEDDVMTPAEHLGDRRARFLEQRPRRAPLGVRRAGLAHASSAAPHRRARLGQHRRRRRMIEIDALGLLKSRGFLPIAT